MHSLRRWQSNASHSRGGGPSPRIGPDLFRPADGRLQRAMRLSRHNEMTSGSNPRILCISPLFAPMADSEAFCSAKMVAALVKAGADVRVLSCSNVVRENPTRDASPSWQELEPLRMDLPTPTERSLWTSIYTGARYRTSMYSRWVARVSKQ